MKHLTFFVIFSNCTLLLGAQIRAIYAVFSGSMAAVCARISLTVSLHNDHYLQLNELLVQNELVHISLVLLVRAVRGILVLVVHPGEVVHGKPSHSILRPPTIVQKNPGS